MASGGRGRVLEGRVVHREVVWRYVHPVLGKRFEGGEDVDWLSLAA